MPSLIVVRIPPVMNPVTPTPPPPSLNAPLLNASPLSNVSIAVTANYTAPPSIATYTFEIATNPSGPWGAPVIQLSPNYTFNGLTAGTTYYFRANVQTTETPSRTSSWSTTASAMTQTLPVIPPATKIIRTDGAGGAYLTQAAAEAAAVPGDIIEWQSVVAGTLQILTDNVVLSAAGTSSQGIVNRVRLGDMIRYRPTSASTGIGKASLNVVTVQTTAAYRTIQGDGVNPYSLQFGDPADWVSWAVGGDNGWANGYPHTYTVLGQGTAHHIFFKGFVQFSGGGTYDAILFPRTTSYIGMQDVALRRHGTNYRTSQDPTGDGLSMYCEHYIIRRAVYDHFGGHDQFNNVGPCGWMSECTGSGIWNDINPIASSPTDTGYRIGEVGAGESAAWTNPNPPYNWTGSPDPQVFGPCGIEACFFNGTGFSTKRPDEPFHEVHSNIAIIRDNWYCDGQGHIWFYANYADAGDGRVQTSANERHQAHYHNTSINTKGLIYQNGFDWQAAGTTMTPDNAELDLWVNNVHQQVSKDVRSGTNYIWLRALLASPTNVPLDGYPDYWKGAIVVGLIVSAGADGNPLNVTMTGTGGATVPIGSAPTQWPNVFSNITVASVTFKSVGTVGSRTQDGLSIVSGPGFNDAPPVTKTTAGSGGIAVTTIPVAYAAFYDPENSASYDLSYFGEQNDFIGVGPTLSAAMANVVQILAGTGNSYTLKSAIQFNSGDGVWFAGNPGRTGGAKFHNNKGAM